jgi:hypothetical protein
MQIILDPKTGKPLSKKQKGRLGRARVERAPTLNSGFGAYVLHASEVNEFALCGNPMNSGPHIQATEGQTVTCNTCQRLQNAPIDETVA